MRRFKGHFAVLLLLGVLGSPAEHAREPAQRIQSKPFLQELRVDKLSKFISAFDIANGSDLAAAALSDLRVRVWRLSSGEVVREFSFPEPETDQRLKLADEVEPISVRFSPDGKMLAISFLSVIHFYDVGNWQEKVSLGVAGEDNLRPDISVTSATPQVKRRTAEEAKTQAEQPIPDINQTMREWAAQRHRGDGRTRITDFGFTRDGSFILAAYCRGACWVGSGEPLLPDPSGKDPVRLWDFRSGRILWEHVYDAQGVINRVVPSPDDKRFAAANAEFGPCTVGVYDLSDGRALYSLPSKPPRCDPPSLLFLPGGESFVTARTEEGPRKNRKDRPWENLAMYETSTGKMIAEFSGRDKVREADISADGRWLASTTWWGRQFQIWDVQARKPIITQVPKEWKWKQYRLIDHVRFSPDGRWLVVGSDSSGELAVYQFGPSWSESSK
jgi:WD40 repeat protein